MTLHILPVHILPVHILPVQRQLVAPTKGMSKMGMCIAGPMAIQPLTVQIGFRPPI